MKIILHNSFTRHEHHVAGNCDELIREIFNKTIMNLENLFPKINITVDYKIPVSNEFKSKDSDISCAPRIWADVCVNWRPEIDDNKILKSFQESEFMKENKDRTAFFKLTTSYENQVEIGLLAANISSPGSVSYSGGYVQIKKSIIYSLPRRSNYICEAIDEIKSLGWPKTFSVSFESARAWVSSILGRSPNISNSKVSRALAAYSMIACGGEEWRSQLLLFWAMMGLEALYCEGSQGLRHQLFEKSQVILGPIRENKKVIKKMYDTRSDFVHGHMNIPHIYAYDSDLEEVNKFRQEISRTSGLAIQMLVATLQFMALHKIEDLNFKYKLS